MHPNPTPEIPNPNPQNPSIQTQTLKKETEIPNTLALPPTLTAQRHVGTDISIPHRETIHIRCTWAGVRAQDRDVKLTNYLINQPNQKAKCLCKRQVQKTFCTWAQTPALGYRHARVQTSRRRALEPPPAGLGATNSLNPTEIPPSQKNSPPIQDHQRVLGIFLL